MSISKNSYDIEKSKFEDDDQSCTISVIDTTEIIASVGINKEQEKKLVRKLDWHILPLYCTFYFADFLDRANIGNAM
jgi:hypothetical protein